MSIIKKFNEDFDTKLREHNYMRIDDRTASAFMASDVKKIHRSGRKIYSVTKDFELIEVTSIMDIKYKTINELFPYLLFITEDFSEVIKDKINLIKQVKELSDRKINTLFDMVRALSQENGSN